MLPELFIIVSTICFRVEVSTLGRYPNFSIHDRMVCFHAAEYSFDRDELIKENGVSADLQSVSICSVIGHQLEYAEGPCPPCVWRECNICGARFSHGMELPKPVVFQNIMSKPWVRDKLEGNIKFKRKK